MHNSLRVLVPAFLVYVLPHTESHAASANTPTGEFVDDVEVIATLPSMVSSQTLSPDKGELSVLLTGLELQTKPSTPPGPQSRTAAIALAVGVAPKERTLVTVDIRGSLVLSKGEACLLSLVSPAEVSSTTSRRLATFGPLEAFFWRAKVPVAKEAASIALAVVLSCYGKWSDGLYKASIDSIDIAWKTKKR